MLNVLQTVKKAGYQWLQHEKSNQITFGLGILSKDMPSLNFWLLWIILKVTTCSIIIIRLTDTKSISKIKKLWIFFILLLYWQRYTYNYNNCDIYNRINYCVFHRKKLVAECTHPKDHGMMLSCCPFLSMAANSKKFEKKNQLLFQ